MKKLLSRIDKINFLKDLERGKASVNELEPDIWGRETIFEDGTSKATIYQDGTEREIEGEELAAFKKQYPNAIQFTLSLCDFSGPPERENVIRIQL